VSQLPLFEYIELFDLHPNANIAFDLQTVGKFIDSVLAMQPSASGGKSVNTPEASLLIYV
jgi:hypothetical protein